MNGGLVVVTRFECHSLWKLLIISIAHRRIRKEVERHARGYLGSTKIVRLRERTLFNISLWEDIESLHSMGRVRRHVEAARMPKRLGVATSGGVYPYLGDWREVLFGSPPRGAPPLRRSEETS